MESTIVKSVDYNAYFGDNHVVKNVNIEIPKNFLLIKNEKKKFWI